TLAGWTARLALWAGVDETLSSFKPTIYEVDLEAACVAFSPAGQGGFARLKAATISGEYKAARSELRSAWARDSKARDRDLYELAQAARANVLDWRQLHG